jgi:hypothetical protein
MRTPTWDAAVADANRLCSAVRRRECRAYQFCDGFDTESSLSPLWETTSGTITIGTAYRRFAPPAGLPGQGAYFHSGGGSGGALARKNLLSNQATLICKVAYYQIAAVGASMNVVGVLDTAFQAALVVTSNGTLQVWRGWDTVGPTLLGQSGPGVIAPNLWYSIEVMFTINASAGAVEAWVNGVQVLNLTGLNTQYTSDAYANQVQLGDGNNLGCYFDDFRVWDGTGSTQNAPLGASGLDSRIISKLPSGAGSSAAFTPNGAAANWQCVDDNPPDGDTTYVSGASSGLIDDYAMPSAGLSTAPVMVVARSLARKDDGATRTLEIGVKSGSTYAYGAGVNLGSSYAYIDSCIALDPNTSAAWTAAGADAAHHAKQETA